MPRLVSRERMIPNGFKFMIPQTNWRSPRFASFMTIVNGAIANLRGNPYIAQQLGWDLSDNAMADRVDQYNAILCKQMGWQDYYVEDGGAAPPIPKSITPASPGSLIGKLVVGGKTVVEWINSGAEAVSPELANTRAKHCLGCPKHGKGGLESYFTVPAQEAIRAALNQRREWKLETIWDNELQVCEACHCPMKLKVHMPIASIVAKLPAGYRDALDPLCWITAESK